MNQHHSTWLTFVVQQFSKLARSMDLSTRLLDHLEIVLALALLDLEPARPTLDTCYAQRLGGRKPRDPVAMLRSFVLMGLLGITSFNKFVKRLRRRVELAVLCGFAPDDIPGVGTFYDFCHRLHDGPRERPCQDTPAPSQQLKGTRGRFRRNLKKEKKKAKKARQSELAFENEGRVAAEARRAMAELKVTTKPKLRDRLQEIFMRCAVIPSAERGLLGDVARLILLGDGSSVVSGASPHGKRVCQCPRETKCDCERLFSDPTATWGWDSYRNQYFFGYRMHAIVAAAQKDLPLIQYSAPKFRAHLTRSERRQRRWRPEPLVRRSAATPPREPGRRLAGAARPFAS
jgi:hypothetical protein